jgi:protein-disulfide isomerase
MDRHFSDRISAPGHGMDCVGPQGRICRRLVAWRSAVRFVYFRRSVDDLAEPAALAAWAAFQQSKFWEYHDALFEQQGKLGEEFYLELANTLKLDVDRFNRDRKSEEAKAAIKKDFELGKSLGVRGTPSFVVNGVFFSGVPEIKDLESLVAQIKAGK